MTIEIGALVVDAMVALTVEFTNQGTPEVGLTRQAYSDETEEIASKRKKLN